MSEEKKADGRQVTLKNVRLSFPTLVEKRATIEGGKEKFSASFIIDPNTDDGKTNIAAILKAVEAAEIAEFKEAGVLAKTVDDPKRMAFRKGEKFKNQEGEVYTGYAGMYAVAAKADKRPKLWDRQKRLVEVADIEDVFVAGYYCDAIIQFYCTSKKEQGGKGLFATVLGIRSRQEGETFGATNNASADDFDDLEDNFDDGSSAGGGLLD